MGHTEALQQLRKSRVGWCPQESAAPRRGVITRQNSCKRPGRLDTDIAAEPKEAAGRAPAPLLFLVPDEVFDEQSLDLSEQAFAPPAGS